MAPGEISAPVTERLRMALGEISAPVVETHYCRWGNLPPCGDISGNGLTGRSNLPVADEYRPPDDWPPPPSLYSEGDEAFAARLGKAPEGEVST